MDERNERGGRPYGRLFARAMERRRRDRQRVARTASYRETGGGYPGYGGTGDREPWDPERGYFGAGFSGYGGRPGGGEPHTVERRGPRLFRALSRGFFSREEGEAKQTGRFSREARVRESSRPSAGANHGQALRAERIGPGAYRRGGRDRSGALH